ncbi:hypothetical protein [Kitasatospora sp. SC0581]|uniref:hypothetical protein n=1 Tax=Kitasatospora sp. SC0581 TaxID=3394360 RepID=UPI003A861EFB
MVYLWGEAVRWVDDEPQPGVVEVCFTDADGRRWSIIGKTAMFGTDQALGPGAWIEADSPFPFPADIDCTVLGPAAGRADEVVTVSIWQPHHLQTVCGRREFPMRRDQLFEE